MDKSDVKHGILCLLEDGRGRTLDEIQDFLKENKAIGYFEESSEDRLNEMLTEMREEGLIEQRFMVDGSDTADFAIEEDGMEFLKTHGERRRKWNTGRPDPNIQKLMQEKMGILDNME